MVDQGLGHLSSQLGVHRCGAMAAEATAAEAAAVVAGWPARGGRAMKARSTRAAMSHHAYLQQTWTVAQGRSCRRLRRGWSSTPGCECIPATHEKSISRDKQQTSSLSPTGSAFRP